MADYHEPYEALSEQAREFHRALQTLIEEIQAVDWYHQRIDVCTDPELKPVLIHNRDEEMEHAAMVLEWLRRRMPGWDDKLKPYLFTQGPITEIEAQQVASNTASDSGPVTRDGQLRVGSLRSASG